MEININRIKSRFGGKILEEDIFKVYNDFKRINDVLKLKLGIEESIVKYFKSKLNIGICNENISKLRMEINGYENELLLLKREEFDDLRSKGKLESYLWNFDDNKLNELNNMGCVRSEEVGDIKLERFRRNRDNYSKNYNELNKDNNVSRVIM
tara:strand:+ start:171 stop:629 length:459 start_codon:yes stop_codon:yes gene_type:complete